MNFQALLYSTTKKTSALLTTLITVLLFCIVQPGYSALSHDQALIWKSLQSEHFDIHFHDQENELAQKTLQTAEQVLTMLQNTLQWTPKTSIDIVLSDERDVAENFSTLFPPKLRISLYLSIPNQFTDFD